MKRFDVLASGFRSLTKVLLLLITILLLSCSSGTEPEKTGSISGTVQLVDDGKSLSLDYSGLKVAVYKPATLDSTIVRINNEYPGIGVIISQETEFDHRLQNPIATATTDASGAYNVSGLSGGVYNVVFLKDGWTVKYLYSVSVPGGGTTALGQMQIKPAISLTESFYSSMEFESDRTYIVNNTMSIVGSASIQRGARIYLNNGSVMKFYSGLDVTGGSDNGNYWWMDTAFNLYSATGVVIDSLQYAGGMSLYGGNTQLSYGLIRRTNYAITTFDGTFSFQDMDVCYFNTGYSLNNSGAILSKVQLRNGSTIGLQALSTSDTLTINKCLVYNTADGVVAYTAGGYSVRDSYFIANVNAVYPQNCSGVVEHNNFYQNTYDIRQYNAQSTISYNNFFHTRNTTLLPRNYALIRNNNFYKSDVFFINIRGGNVNTYSIVQADLDAKENYWAVSNIDPFILDKLDNANYPGTECIFQVNYLPKKYSMVVDAGIRG